MRNVVVFFAVLALGGLVSTPAVAQIEGVGNIGNAPDLQNLPNLDNLDLPGPALLTIRVPLLARNLHEDVERIEIGCFVTPTGASVVIAGGTVEERYTGGTLRRTVSVPINFDEGEEGLVQGEEGLVQGLENATITCAARFMMANGDKEVPSKQTGDPRLLLAESSSAPTWSDAGRQVAGDMIASAQDEIEEVAALGGEWRDAQSVLEEARAAYEAGDYETAIALANQAENMARQALQAIDE